jgi:hypothetical protein
MINDIDDDAIATEIILQCLARTPHGTICPSEVARALAGENEWRSLMPDVRRVAHILAREGKVAIMQRGAVVDHETARGPIRVTLRVNPAQLREAVRRALQRS